VRSSANEHGSLNVLKEGYPMAGVNGFAGRTRSMRFNPSQFLVMGFGAVILLGSILLSLPAASVSGEGVRYVDALFTATSATCVTGLVVVDTATTYSLFGQVVVLLLIQVGGLGFMAMATMMALVLGRRITLRGRLVLQESLNQFTLAGLVRLTRYLFLTTVIVEGIGAFILCLRFSAQFPLGKSAYYGIFHSVSAFCNAGFDLFGTMTGPFTSLTGWQSDPVIVLTIGSLIVTGGLGFPVIIELIGHHRGNRLSLHTRLVLQVTGILLLGAALAILGLEISNPNSLKPLTWTGKLLGAVFQSITPRTAGFNTLDISKLRDGTLFIMITLMFIGASPSSTGGGIKTTTFGALIASVVSTAKGRDDVEMHERRLPHDEVLKAMTIATLAMGLVTGVTLILSVTENARFLEVLFETTSAFGTVGLTMGITPSLSDVGRLLIMATMFMGRVGPLTVVIALAQRKRQPSTVHLAEERILIG
jgi:trk system potassium uptake protein TrkH